MKTKPSSQKNKYVEQLVEQAIENSDKSDDNDEVPITTTNRYYSIEYIIEYCVPTERRQAIKDEFLSRFRDYGADNARKWISELTDKEKWVD